MRISAETSSPDYHPAATHCTVRFNGVEIKNCVWCDDETGRAILVNGDGQRERRRGIVRLSFPEKCAQMPGWPPIPERYIVRIKPGIRGLAIAR